MRHEATKVRNLRVTYPRESGAGETKDHSEHPLDTAVSPRFRAKDKILRAGIQKIPAGSQ